MKNRFLSVCFVLAVAGSMMGSAAFADTSLRWKTPKINSGQATAQQASLVTPALLRESKFQTENGLVEQVRYQVEHGAVPPPGPSRTAEIDTFYPESRPQPRTTLPLTPPMPESKLFDDSLQTPKSLEDFDKEPIIFEDTGQPRSGVRPQAVEIKCPESGSLKSLHDIGYSIKLDSTGERPKECGLGETVFPQRNWNRICFMWKASALCHKPLYFEDEALERYGHTYVREEFQPIISGLHFFLTIPVLPYKMGINPPCECIYTLGHYRPGDCAPYMLDPLPLSVRAALIEAAVIVGGVAIFP